ncbi:MAG: ACP S-malonyltransferase [Candidatus Melainabacteria bacterium]|nr:ACP S-malonyltransferase [Candidatus Melainabacteria bacterium]
MGKIACLFPGQGSQSVGMGGDLVKEFEEARQLFQTVDQIAGRSLSKLCIEGPEEELKRTVNTQPTILSVSLAAWKCYQSLGGPKPDFVAGHSLGEITALVAANVLTVEDAVRLVDKRARLMEECPKGAMSAVLGVPADVLEKCCADAHAELKDGGAKDIDAVVIVANFNTRDQLVISGNPDAVVKAGEKAKAAGGKVIPLPVGGAFHSPLMSAASIEFAGEIAKAQFQNASCAVVQNFDAQPSTSAAEIKEKLGRQMESAVRWCATIEYMLSQGVDTFIEIGPGKVLVGTVKKIDKSARMFNVSDSTNLKATIQELGHALV